MTYQETIDYLFHSTPVFERTGASAYKPGLQTTLALDEHFGHPHTQYKTIHIAGTNGKGSCSHTLAAILQNHGYKVGLYTSPHLIDFRERIRINGECIPEQYVIDFVEQNRAFFEPLHPSFFELTTAMAFKYFAEQKVDYAVIEVGLGGRLDCTNIITPILSIITNISLDHTQLLGNTLAKIAREKAGIIKPGVPVIIGEANDETWPVFKEVAQEKSAPIFLAQNNKYVKPITKNPKGDDYEDAKNYYQSLFIGNFGWQLRGNYQEKNVKTVLNAALFLAGILPISVSVRTTKDGLYLKKELISLKDGIIDSDDIVNGFEHVCDLTGLRGRWEKLNTAPLTICDIGHNVAGWKNLAPQIGKQPQEKKHIVFGMVDDKDVEHVLDLLKEYVDEDVTYYWTQPSTPRAFPVEQLQKLAIVKGLKGSAYPSVAEAYNAAKANAKKEDFIFIGGSNYVVADLLTNCF